MFVFCYKFGENRFKKIISKILKIFFVVREYIGLICDIYLNNVECQKCFSNLYNGVKGRLLFFQDWVCWGKEYKSGLC